MQQRITIPPRRRDLVHLPAKPRIRSLCRRYPSRGADRKRRVYRPRYRSRRRRDCGHRRERFNLAAWGAFLELCRQALQAAPQRPARLAIASLLQLMREGSDDQIATEAWRWLGAMQLAPPHPQILRGAIDQFGNFAFDSGDVGTAPSVAPIAAAVRSGRRPARVLASRSVVQRVVQTIGSSAVEPSCGRVMLKQTVCLSPDFASVPGKSRVFSHYADHAGRQLSAETRTAQQLGAEYRWCLCRAVFQYRSAAGCGSRYRRRWP